MCNSHSSSSSEKKCTHQKNTSSIATASVLKTEPDCHPVMAHRRCLTAPPRAQQIGQMKYCAQMKSSYFAVMLWVGLAGAVPAPAQACKQQQLGRQPQTIRGSHPQRSVHHHARCLQHQVQQRDASSPQCWACRTGGQVTKMTNFAYQWVHDPACGLARLQLPGERVIPWVRLGTEHPSHIMHTIRFRHTTPNTGIRVKNHRKQTGVIHTNQHVTVQRTGLHAMLSP